MHASFLTSIPLYNIYETFAFSTPSSHTYLRRFINSLVASSNSSAAGRFSRCSCRPSPKVGEPRREDHGDAVLPAAAAADVAAAAAVATAAGVAEAGEGAEGTEEGKKEARLLVLVRSREAKPEGSFMSKDGPQARKEAGTAAEVEEDEDDEEEDEVEEDVSVGGAGAAAAAAAAVEVAVVGPPPLAPPPSPLELLDSSTPPPPPPLVVVPAVVIDSAEGV